MVRTKKVEIARNMAKVRHAGQLYGDRPYIDHLDMVYAIVVAAGLDEDYQVAAYLHDILEDTVENEEEKAELKAEIVEKFGVRVAEMVESVTGEGKSRKERKQSMIKKLELFNDGISLKMADRLGNMLESEKDNPRLFQMYINELPDYLELFKKGDAGLFSKFGRFIETKKMKP